MKTSENTINRVYKFGCRAPRDGRGGKLVEQILGQAHNYAEALRRAHNDSKRAQRNLYESKDDAAHVLAFVYRELNAAVCEIRSPKSRGHLIDHGTYWLEEEAMHQASKKLGRDPIQRRFWDGSGRIGVALMSNQKFAAEGAWTHPRVQLSLPNAKGHAEICIRVGPMKAPETLTWPIKLHRPFPKGSVVTGVVMQRERVGHRFRWNALVSLAMPVVERDELAVGTVGVDLGWRKEAEGVLRVATHDGGADRGCLAIDTAGAYAYANAVRGFRDAAFNLVKEYAAEKGLEGAEHARLWKSKDRVYRLAKKHPADLGLAWWVDRDKHLEDIECGVRMKAQRRRLDAFRVYADKLAKTYRTLALEDMSMAAWVGEAPASELERNRSAASLAELQSVLALRFGADRVDWIAPAYTSMSFSDCGAVRSEKVGPRATWTCEACGVTHHQDENAAKVLRDLSERWSAEKKAPRARKPKPKEKKVKKGADGIATGNEIRSVVTPRQPVGEAAE